MDDSLGTVRVEMSTTLKALLVVVGLIAVGCIAPDASTTSTTITTTATVPATTTTVATTTTTVATTTTTEVGMAVGEQIPGKALWALVPGNSLEADRIKPGIRPMGMGRLC